MAQQPPTHYAVLGIATDATAADIRAAFKAACLRTHPDRLPSSIGAEQRDECTRLFHMVVAAANCLLDPQAKARYDAFVFGVKLIDVSGRVSETVELLDPESEFEASADNPCLYTRECRCGGTYSVVLQRQRGDKSTHVAAYDEQQQQPVSKAAASAASASSSTTSTAKRFATCDSCSLVLEVLCPT